ncbi:hypothetical protein NN3_00110 [Nocardia neocaledoniensis NBRC 108232]|nr:hypothetical protein NN3_00110 [Nocardia neocaledoniensis NBRC 108232]
MSNHLTGLIGTGATAVHHPHTLVGRDLKLAVRLFLDADLTADKPIRVDTNRISDSLQRFRPSTLTRTERAAIRRYTSNDGYRGINKVLRGATLPPEMRSYHDDLVAAIRKLPPYRGIVHRVTSPTPADLAR